MAHLLERRRRAVDTPDSMIRNSKAPWWLRSLAASMLVISTLTFFIHGLFWILLGSIWVLMVAVVYAKATKKA
jgi:hypothetical protein